MYPTCRTARQPLGREPDRVCAARCRVAEDWRTDEAWDKNLHLAVVRATHIEPFQYFFKTLNLVRQAIVPGQTRATRYPSSDLSQLHRV